jgi:hypothetical protein
MTLYEQDFYQWTQQQASLLRAGRWREIDRDHLVEEIETMGRSERAQLETRLGLLLMHLLKWQYQPTLRSRSWLATIKEQRRRVSRLIDRNPSLTHDLSEILWIAYGDAALMAEEETGLAEETFPAQCPYTLEEVLDPAFLPGT